MSLDKSEANFPAPIIDNNQPKKFIACLDCKNLAIADIIKCDNIKLYCKTCQKCKEYKLNNYVNDLENLLNENKYCEVRQDHNKIIAQVYCVECNLYMCLDCQTSHNFFLKNHTIKEGKLTCTNKIRCGKHNKPFIKYCQICLENFCEDCSDKIKCELVNFSNEQNEENKVNKEIKDDK